MAQEPHSFQNYSLPNQPSQEGEFSFLDFFIFLWDSWKKLLIASAFGAALGWIGWFFGDNYSAEFVLQNTKLSNSEYAFDLIAWKTLQKSLPSLAVQAVEENRVPENEASFYRVMSSERWWQKNITPNYLISKSDSKDLAGISKDLDSTSTTILSFTLVANAPSKQKSLENVLIASRFLRSGGAYLQIRTLLSGYEGEMTKAKAETDQRMNVTQIEIGYLSERLKALEELNRRFPGNSASSINQQITSNDNGGKYLPLATQIIAANTDINEGKEKLSRLKRVAEQLSMQNFFLVQALPLQDKTLDGLVLVKQLLEIEASLRAKTDKNLLNELAVLDNLRAQLLGIEFRFTKGLESNAPPVSVSKGMVQSVFGGLAAVFFIMLLFLLCQRRVWLYAKSGNAI